MDSGLGANRTLGLGREWGCGTRAPEPPAKEEAGGLGREGFIRCFPAGSLAAANTRVSTSSKCH